MKKAQIISSLFIIAFVNLLFLIKYTPRFTNYSIAISLILSILFFVFYFFKDSLKITNKRLNIIFVGAIPLYIIGAIMLLNLFPLDKVNVDRYSVINSFWDNYFQSKYVYFAKSHHGNMPGPMPFYFILSLPFYILGDIGYLSITGLIVFAAILKYANITPSRIISGVVIILCTGFTFWEIVSRSNIFINSSLVLLSIIFFVRKIDINRKQHILLNGVIIGLLISTRNVLIIPYIVLFLHVLKEKKYLIRDMIQISICIVSVYILTFVPFVMNHFSDFIKMNPFIIQSSYLMPSWMSISCIVLSFSSLFLTKSYKDIIYYSGMYLFITITIYSFYHIYKTGFHDAFYNSKIDISYYILCIPFLTLHLLNKETSFDQIKKLAFEVTK